MIETVEIEIGDWVEVWQPSGSHCVAWGYVRKDPDPEGNEEHTVVEVSASFHPDFPVAKRVRFPSECVFKMEAH